MRAQLHQAADLARGRVAAGPHRAGRGHVAGVQRLCRAYQDGAGDRLDVEHVPWPAVRRGLAELQPAALADGEAVAALVLSDHLAVGPDDPARGGPEPAAQESPGVTVGDEADVVAVWLVGDGEPARGRQTDRQRSEEHTSELQ